MNADDILATAANIVGGERARLHGRDKERSFGLIAEFWRLYLNARHNQNVVLSDEDVAMMMDLLKTARICTGSKNPDNYVDKVGYAAIAGEIADPS